MPPAVPVDKEKSTEVVEVEGKVLERSQQDGELYSKPTIGIIYPPPEVRSILSNVISRFLLFVICCVWCLNICEYFWDAVINFSRDSLSVLN